MDIAVAVVAYRRALERGLGQPFAFAEPRSRHARADPTLPCGRAGR